MPDDTLTLACQLIERPSITPDDAGCQALLAEHLQPLGFECETMQFGDVTNLWAKRGNAEPLFVFAGHTDVVPTGPLEKWHSNPFVPEIRDGLLYGRGAADMKSSIAAMVTACERFIADHADHRGSIAFLITSDEEGPSIDGTVKVVEALQQRGEQITWALVGEPSSSDQLGDIIKNGRRGSIGAKLVIKGIQGHVAYPQLVKNPIHLAMPALSELVNYQWDQGNDHFPATSLQISNINAGTGAVNVVPGELEVFFNLRFSTETSEQTIRKTTKGILDAHGLEYDIEWRLSGQPFLTPEGELVAAAQQAILRHTGQPSTLSTSGGTSDGRFIAPTGAQVLELGPINESIHKINEHVRADDLQPLSMIYEDILQQLLS